MDNFDKEKEKGKKKKEWLKTKVKTVEQLPGLYYVEIRDEHNASILNVYNSIKETVEDEDEEEMRRRLWGKDVLMKWWTKM